MPPAANRLEQLQLMLQKSPCDTFLLYGIAMEHKKLGALEKAVESFDAVLAVDPGYCYAYYQRAQVQEQMGQVAAAKQSYLDGIAAAKRVGDAHALSELETALAMVG